jgi:hypothetical protein
MNNNNNILLRKLIVLSQVRKQSPQFLQLGGSPTVPLKN